MSKPEPEGGPDAKILRIAKQFLGTAYFLNYLLLNTSSPHVPSNAAYISLISCSHISQPRSAGESSSSYSVAEHYLTGWHLACVGVLKVKVMVDSLDCLPTVHGSSQLEFPLL